MKRHLTFIKPAVLALVAILLVSSTSYAQRSRGGRGFGSMSKAALLGSEQVQKELNVTEEQKGKIKEIADESRKGGRELFSGLRELPEEERRKKFEELREKMTKAAEEASKKIAGVLDETQNKRLEEIVLQTRGTSAFSDKEVAAKLKITEEQQQKIKDLVDAQREMQRELFSGIRDLPRDQIREKFQEMRKKGEELRTETQKAVMEVLTAEQKSQFEEMKGEKFELDRSALFRGFGRRRGGDGERRKNRDNNDS